MAEAAPKGGRAWTLEEVQQLRELVRGNTPTRLIGMKLGRTASAVQSKAAAVGISLKPANQSPYGS
jgi:hypothetical protein